MNIKKEGFIYCPSGKRGWDTDTFMTPHAMKVHEGEIRIWGGCRDKDGISRISYIDVDESNPSKIIRENPRVVLDAGSPGCFDDNGVILGDVIKVEDKYYMYYVGFQHVQKVKFYAFSGLAISEDGGETFKRASLVPVLDRTDTGLFGRCIHTVMYDEGAFKCWYAIIHDWKVINGIPYPVYDIWYTESKDGIHFPAEDKVQCITTKGDEYRIGRPKVYKTPDGYEMFYTRDLVTKEYIPGYAVSKDGVNWTRKDDEFQLTRSESGWDSEMTCYPVKLVAQNRTYMFYGGNGMGKTGVGYASIK